MIKLILIPLIPIFLMMARSELMAWQRRRREEEDTSRKRRVIEPREYNHNLDEEDDRNSHS